MIRGIASIVNDKRLDILLENSESLGFSIIAIDGLAPSGATINSSGGALIHGTRINSVKIEPRTISIPFVIHVTGKKEEAVRETLYNFFPTGTKIRFEIKTDRRTVFVMATPEDFDIRMFATEENGNISLFCESPFFTDVIESYFVASETEALFEFPFSNESLTEPLLEIGIQNQYPPRVVIDYPGDVLTGVVMTLEIEGDVRNISIINIRDNQAMTIDTEIIYQTTYSRLKAGDKIIIDTRSGSKSIKLFRDGVFINILNCLPLHSHWINLAPGYNEILYMADNRIEDLTLELRFNALYSGVV